MYDVHAKTAPKSLLDKFAKINTKHHYNTRLSAKECFSVKFSRTEEMKKSFTGIGVSIWNSIPLSVKTLNISNYWAACAKPSNKMGLVFPSGTNRTLACSARAQDISVCVDLRRMRGIDQRTSAQYIPRSSKRLKAISNLSLVEA